jgi:hypothetical protein
MQLPKNMSRCVELDVHTIHVSVIWYLHGLLSYQVNLAFLPRYEDAFTPNVKSVLSNNLHGILGGSQC